LYFSEQKSDEDYETVLLNLANDIQKRQTKLSEIRLRERRSTLVVTLYTLAAWVGYVSLWYLNALPDLKDGRYIRNGSTEKAFKGLPVIIGPILCVYINFSMISANLHFVDLGFSSFDELFKFGIRGKEMQKVISPPLSMYFIADRFCDRENPERFDEEPT
jgi:hypothetical protein